jgi:hypothetical protein
MDMSSTREPFSTTCTFRIHNKPVNKMWEWTAVPSVPVTAKAMLPSTSAVTIELAHGVKMITFVNTVSQELLSSCMDFEQLYQRAARCCYCVAASTVCQHMQV